MITRLLIAFVGGLAVTAGLLLAMNQVAETLRTRDPTKFFQITDVIVLRSGRWRPERPAVPERPPERTAPERHRPAPGIGIEAPPRPNTAPAPGLEIPPITLPDAPID
jgi:hypothetical protein